MKQTARTSGEKDDIDHINGIADLLRPLDTVREVDIREHRRPILLDVYLKTDEIPPEVKDIIDEAGLVIEDIAHGSNPYGDGLNLTMYAIREYEYFETLTVRKHGNSFVVTLPQDVREKAGAEMGDAARLYARPGDIKIEIGR